MKRTTDPHDRQHCREVFARLSEYLDNEMEVTLRKTFEQHMQNCIPCKVCLATLKRTIGLCSTLQDQPLPPDFVRKLHTDLNLRIRTTSTA